VEEDRVATLVRRSDVPAGRIGSSLLLGATLALGLGAPAFAAPDLVASAQFPLVVPADGSSSALLAVKVTGAPASVTLHTYLGNAYVPLQPMGGDVWSIVIPPADLLAGYSSGHANRNFAGWIEVVASPGDEPVKYNFVVLVDDAAIPPVSIRDFGSAARCSPHLVNVLVPGDPWASLLEDPAPATSLFYEAFPDTFDFMALVNAYPSIRSNRFHRGLRNDVLGIGLPSFDNGAGFGSSSQLQSILHFPIPTFFDLAEPGALHEIGHRWINHLDSPSLVADDGSSHWPPSDLARGLMGWSGPSGTQGLAFPWSLVPQGGGTYLVQPEPSTGLFSPMDLYLMGLATTAEVPPFVVVDPKNQPIAPGSVVTGSTASAADVVSSNGPRVPAASWPQSFSLAPVVASRTGLLSDREMAFFDYFAARAEAASPVTVSVNGLYVHEAQPFRLATNGRGSLSSTVPCFQVLAPDLPQYVAACKYCPPTFKGLDLLIRTAEIRDERLRTQLRSILARGGEAWTRGDTRGASEALSQMQDLLRQAAGGSIGGVSSKGLLAVISQVAGTIGGTPGVVPGR
jgi:hypothetical protein